MNPYALPNIIAFSLLLVVSFAVILRNSRDKNNQLLFGFFLLSTLSVGAGVMLHLWTGEAQANFRKKRPYFFGVPSYILLIEYILQISSRVQWLKETFLWRPSSIHRVIIYAGLYLKV